jgi:hypothetical protein
MMKALLFISAIFLSLTAPAQWARTTYVDASIVTAKQEVKKSLGDSLNKVRRAYADSFARVKKAFGDSLAKRDKVVAAEVANIRKSLIDSMAVLPGIVWRETLRPLDSTYKAFLLSYKPIAGTEEVQATDDGEKYYALAEGAYRFLKTIPEKMVTVKPYRYPLRIRYAKQ